MPYLEGPMDTLKVQMEPEILVIEEGQSATLNCNVTGTTSVLTWSKDDGLLSDNHLVNNYQLNITKATIKDEGTYFCIAKHKDVEARSSSIIQVKSESCFQVFLNLKWDMTREVLCQISISLLLVW